jgi:hypothetical protein
MNADLMAGFGQQSDRTKVFLRNKNSHDDAVAREAQIIREYPKLLASRMSSTSVARMVKSETGDPRTVETIAKAVQTIRKQM